MSEWTCDQVGGWIDLYAAGEADAPTRAAVGRHLEACPVCADAHQEARQLLGLLDQRFQESERLRRLWARLEAEPKWARRPVRLALWRAAAIAASVLLTFGLFGWMEPREPAAPRLQLAAVLNPPAVAPGGAEAMMVRNVSPKELDDMWQGVVYPLELGGKSPAVFWHDLRAANRIGQPPLPPAVDLELTVRNPGRDVLPLRLDDPESELLLDLQGPGALDAPAPDAAAPLAELGTIRLGPGESTAIPIRKLVSGRAGAVRYLYWTEPGEYTLTVLLRAVVGGGPREVVATSGPIRVRVTPQRGP